MKLKEVLFMIVAVLSACSAAHRDQVENKPEPRPTTLPQLQSLRFSSSIEAQNQGQILEDLDLLGRLTGSGGTPLFQEIFGSPFLGTALLNFFTQRISSFDANSCGGGAGLVGCVRPLVASDVMWLTPSYFSLGLPQIYRLSVLFHESRHTEMIQMFWPHVKCPRPFQGPTGKDIVGILSGVELAGLPACDSTAYGAYAVQAELLKNTELFCQNCSEKIKMDAHLFGEDNLHRIVDPEALKKLRHDVEPKK